MFFYTSIPEAYKTAFFLSSFLYPISICRYSWEVNLTCENTIFQNRKWQIINQIKCALEKPYKCTFAKYLELHFGYGKRKGDWDFFF